jgi:hypothetical protein
MIQEQVINLQKEFDYQSLSYYQKDVKGAFFIASGGDNMKAVSFVNRCREDFSYNFLAYSEWIGFVNKNEAKIKKANSFFDKVEELLGERAKVTLAATNDPKVLLVKTGSFWRKDAFRRGMFTLLLRCSCAYYRKDFNKWLNCYPLLRSMLPAMQFFLAGNVTPKQNLLLGGYSGVVQYCRSLQTREQLVAKFHTRKGMKSI